MNLVNHILAYLKFSPSKGIMSSKQRHLVIKGYIVGSRLNRKSTSRYVSFTRGNLVTWRSAKQNEVSLSNTEVEYHVLYHATTELTWLRILLSELGFDSKKPMVLFFFIKQKLLRLQIIRYNIIKLSISNLTGVI